MSTQIDLQGRVAVVTGGAGGIGRGISERLAQAGAHVVVADIDHDRSNECVAAITEAGGSATSRPTDVRDPAAVEVLRAAVVDAHGGPDILVNNVGHYLRARPFARSAPQHWQDLYEVNFLHVMAVTHAFLGAMLERGAGSIVNVSSVEGIRGYPPDPVYGAFKAAVGHFTRCLALEVAPAGVRVNAIAPDVTQSIQVDYEAMVPPESADRWPVWVPVGRPGTAADQADVVLFLVSDLARFVTGHVIPTDGGTLAAGGWFRAAETGRWTNRPRDP